MQDRLQSAELCLISAGNACLECFGALHLPVITKGFRVLILEVEVLASRQICKYSMHE